MRGVVVGAIVAVMGVGLALPVSAKDFALNGWISTELGGYKHPPASYKVGDAFTFTFNLRNDRNTARTVCLETQIYRLTTLNASSTLTEAQLETLVHDTNPPQVKVKTFPMGTHTIAPYTTKAALTANTVLDFATGVFQFDTGPCGENFAPGNAIPFNAGFIRVVAAAVVATPTPTPTSGGGVLGSGGSTAPSAGVLTLAATGSGAQPQGGVSWLALLLGMALLAAAGLGLMLRRVR
jgi:hypothetical protein